MEHAAPASDAHEATDQTIAQQEGHPMSTLRRTPHTPNAPAFWASAQPSLLARYAQLGGTVHTDSTRQESAKARDTARAAERKAKQEVRRG